MFFSLNKLFASNTSVDPDDTRRMKGALNGLGFYDADKENSDTSPIPNRRVFNAVKDYQRDNGLRVDGVVKPDGETHRSLKEKMKQGFGAGMDFMKNDVRNWAFSDDNAFGDFNRNFNNMNKEKVIDGDKYFHCKANYEATKRTWKGHDKGGWAGHDVAYGLSWAKEAKDSLKGKYSDGDKDHEANRHGRWAARV